MNDDEPAPLPRVERTILVDPDRLLAFFEASRRLGKHARASLARRIVILAMGNLCASTGQVMLTRDQLAALLGIATPGEVSFALSTLERLGVIRREVRPEAGRRGSGRVCIFMNPAIAWSGTAEARARWAGLPRPRDRRERSGDDR